MRSAFALVAIALVPAAAYAQTGKPDAAGVAFFETKIRPVLVQQCYQCHSQEAQKNKKLRGDLLLDSKAGLLHGGATGPAIVPGNVKESLLLKALRHEDDLKMPPKGKLADQVVADFTKWVGMGAPDPRDGTPLALKKEIDIEAGKKYWAFQKLVAPTPPKVKNAGWAKTPLDPFILARLEEKQLAPNSAVSKEKLVRRAYYDLLGLPPTPEEVTAFLSDTAPDAYERLIDRLLLSEHYGERWARHWLDVARFAESAGYEFDKDRPNAYHYRDFVIKALNQDMPYDQFIRRQVAGDHLEPQNVEAVAATGFLVAGPFPGQVTAKTLQLIRYNHLDDMVATLGSAMLGMSVGCARCHDHKYDPVPQEDYYRLIACLGRTDSTEAKIDLDPTATSKAKALFDQTHAPLLAARDKFEKEQLPGQLQKWLAVAKDKSTAPWLLLDAEAKGKATLRKLDDGSWLASGKPGKGDVFTIVGQTYLKGVTAIRVEALPDDSLPQKGPGRGARGDFALSEISVTAAPLTAKAKAVPVKLKPMPGEKGLGWSIKEGGGKGHAAVFATEAPAGFEGGALLTITLKFDASAAEIGRFRVAFSTLAQPVPAAGDAMPQNQRELLALADKGELTAKNRDGVLHWLRSLDADTNKIYADVDEHAKKTPQPKLANVFAASSGKGGDVYFLTRGEVEKKTTIMQPGFVQVLMTAAEKDQRWAEKSTPPRVALGNWLTDNEHGAGNLLARVIVNRLWQHHMGRGIVATPNDFGVQGEPPTHPELLDYLAAELIRNGWRLKPIHKLIMTSTVYRQSGEVNPANMQADSQNRLWWRRPARRLEAEAIRDAVLAVSGTLDKTMYGPGSLDANTARRSVYLKVKRSQMVPMMQMFDAPEAQQSIGERPTTTVATQSLAFMNSPFVRQRADKFAQRLRPKSMDALMQTLDDGYLMALSRRPTEEERSRMAGFVRGQVELYGTNPRALDMAITDFCHVLLCLNEFVYVD